MQIKKYRNATLPPALALMASCGVLVLLSVLVTAQAQTAPEKSKAPDQSPIEATIEIGGREIRVERSDLNQIKLALVESIRESTEPYADSLAQRTLYNPSFMSANGKPLVGGLWIIESNHDKAQDYAILKFSGRMPSTGVALIPTAKLTRTKNRWEVGRIVDDHVFLGGRLNP